MMGGICGVCSNYVSVLDVRGVCAGCAPKYYAAMSPMLDSVLDATQDEQRRETRLRMHMAAGTLTLVTALIYAADGGLEASTLPWWRTLITASTTVAFVLLTHHNYVMYHLARSRKI